MNETVYTARSSSGSGTVWLSRRMVSPHPGRAGSRLLGNGLVDCLTVTSLLPRCGCGCACSTFVSFVAVGSNRAPWVGSIPITRSRIPISEGGQRSSEHLPYPDGVYSDPTGAGVAGSLDCAVYPVANARPLQTPARASRGTRRSRGGPHEPGTIPHGPLLDRGQGARKCLRGLDVC